MACQTITVCHSSDCGVLEYQVNVWVTHSVFVLVPQVSSMPYCRYVIPSHAMQGPAQKNSYLFAYCKLNDDFDCGFCQLTTVLIIVTLPILRVHNLAWWHQLTCGFFVCENYDPLLWLGLSQRELLNIRHSTQYQVMACLIRNSKLAVYQFCRFIRWKINSTDVDDKQSVFCLYLQINEWKLISR